MDQKLSIEFDDDRVRVVVIAQLEAAWNQEFRWSDIDRVCFKDGGLYSSDVILIGLKGRQTPAVILTEARGGADFFRALSERGYFPEEVWRSAMRETNGAMYCWPQKSTKELSAWFG